MNTTERKQQLVEEYNNLVKRQQEIIGAIKILVELEESQKVKVEVKEKKDDRKSE